MMKQRDSEVKWAELTPDDVIKTKNFPMFFEIKIPKFVRFPKFEFGTGASTRIYNNKAYIN